MSLYRVRGLCTNLMLMGFVGEEGLGPDKKNNAKELLGAGRHGLLM